eukprot:CAMPEP_0206323584 /NCGR_PEP_ID=MMETSP0106_2-20121207/20062_1 /ASSEMBLY_ACC=CAM_ASM_000206 /TAXON_ID=81532 /ORGANISM="Acanthoeca-like sp., Strain 10tr" /LENGTH=62 /DNA_ID=CAMNT_0053755883 /DNA_START=19 /DNA_END=204 /DNA_ORIENTATION=-
MSATWHAAPAGSALSLAVTHWPGRSLVGHTARGSAEPPPLAVRDDAAYSPSTSHSTTPASAA